MRFGSLFSGIGGLDLGLERAGMDCAWQVEADPFRRAVLKTHWPEVKRYEDVRTVGRDCLESVDCICAGVPCQDVSVAGKRAGLAGKRTGLFFDFARILAEIRPTWFLFENVPGLLSSNQGRDFAEILRVFMGGCRYGVAWRILDSRFFGVAQRRRRLFIVGYSRGPCPAEVLFEPAGGGRDLAAGGQAGTDVAGAITTGVGRVGSRGADDGANIVPTLSTGKSPSSGGRAPGMSGDDAEALVVSDDGAKTVARALATGSVSSGYRYDPNGEEYVIQDSRGGANKKQNGIGIQRGGPCYTLTKVDQHAVAFPLTASNGHHGHSSPRGDGADNLVVASTITASAHKSGGASAGKDSRPRNAVVCPPIDADGVRDFTGLPEGLDSARYRALGDAVTVSVAEWIGRRIVNAGGLHGA